MLINKRLLMITAKCLLALLMVCTVFSMPVAADEVVTVQEHTIAAVPNKQKSKKVVATKCYQPVDSWKPYHTWIGNCQDQNKRFFLEGTMGLGFLYFSGAKGNFNGIPAPIGSINMGTLFPLEGKIGYNRVPVYEYSLGYRIFNWFKLAIAIQNQDGIDVQTESLQPRARGTRISDSTYPDAEFRANLDLDAVYAKFMFELPWVAVWKSYMYAAYLNLGVGPAWQSWTNNRVYETYLANSGAETTFVNTLNQKYPANVFWQVDAGIRMKAANPASAISFLIGCKFSSWGRVGNIGKQTEQGSWSYALAEPFHASMLYSFAPYVGAQWSF